MVLLGPDTEDKSKIHNEINQIVNQRFILTTFAVTVFGVIIVWLLPGEKLVTGSIMDSLTFIGSGVLLWLLFIIFVLGVVLRFFLRIRNQIS